MADMKKIDIPPAYLFASLMISTVFFYLMPAINLIPFPYNLGGLALIAGGMVLNSKANDLFRRHETPHDFREPVRLIREGIFMHTRNPMYAGMFVIALGYAICWGNATGLASAILFLAILHYHFIPMEEGRMTRIFGREYENYRNAVRRWI